MKDESITDTFFHRLRDFHSIDISEKDASEDKGEATPWTFSITLGSSNQNSIEAYFNTILYCYHRVKGYGLFYLFVVAVRLGLF